MKKISLFACMMLLSINMNAGFYLVQSGADGAAVWSDDVATAKSATIVDLTKEGKTIDAWLTTIKSESAPDVWVVAGTYKFSAAAQLAAGIKVYGGFAGTETAIAARTLKDGGAAWEFENETVFDGQSACVFFSNNTNSTVSGITFQNGKSTANGGAFRTGNNSKVLNCQFLNNEANAGSGQGVVQIYNANVTITDCLFKGGKAGQGAGVYANIAAANSVTVTGCCFIGNSASGTANAGGAIHYQNAGTFVIDRCYFENNTAAGNGAAISFAGTGANSKIINSVLTAQTGSKNAIFAETGLIAYNTVVENEGGAIYAKKAEIKNNVLWGTSKAKAGLAVNFAAVTFDHNASVIVPAGDTKESNTVKLDSINSGSEEGVNYPEFKDVENKDFDVKYASALREAGVVIADITTDYKGTTRSTTAPTIGAYECTAPVPTAIESNVVRQQVVKTMMNGQVVLIKNGVKYNVLGARL